MRHDERTNVRLKIPDLYQLLLGGKFRLHQLIVNNYFGLSIRKIETVVQDLQLSGKLKFVTFHTNGK